MAQQTTGPAGGLPDPQADPFATVIPGPGTAGPACGPGGCFPARSAPESPRPASEPAPVAPPRWLARAGAEVAGSVPDWFAEFAPPATPRRTSAVLILVAGDGPRRPGAAPELAGLDVVLTERAHHLSSHAAQVSFPGGHIDARDDGPVAAALREASEEVGLDPDSVEVIRTLPPLYMRPRGNAVTPVLGWWREPHAIGVVDPGEVAQVVRVPLADLADPANRFTVTGPGAYRGPGFGAGGLFVWGFTAKLLDAILALGGVARPWDARIERPLPEDQLRPFFTGRA